MLKVGLVQMAMSSEVSDNLEKAVSMSEEAASQGADVICLPELFTTPYFPREEDPEGKRERGAFLSTIPGMVTETLSDLARRTGTVVIGGSIYEAAEDGLFNTSPVFDSDGRMLGKYRKTHIPHDECFYEQDYYTPADTGFHVYDTTVGTIGVVICFDRHFPESIRTCVLKGAQIIIIPTANTKSEPLELFEWEMRVSAMQNGVFIAMCNRVGVEGEMDFAGESLVVDPNGAVIAKADDRAQLLLADLDLAMVERSRQSRPYLALRRPEYYAR